MSFNNNKIEKQSKHTKKYTFYYMQWWYAFFLFHPTMLMILLPIRAINCALVLCLFVSNTNSNIRFLSNWLFSTCTLFTTHIYGQDTNCCNISTFGANPPYTTIVKILYKDHNPHASVKMGIMCHKDNILLKI